MRALRDSRRRGADQFRCAGYIPCLQVDRADVDCEVLEGATIRDGALVLAVCTAQVDCTVVIEEELHTTDQPRSNISPYIVVNRRITS
jgi:hypothetical protein